MVKKRMVRRKAKRDAVKGLAKRRQEEEEDMDVDSSSDDDTSSDEEAGSDASSSEDSEGEKEAGEDDNGVPLTRYNDDEGDDEDGQEALKATRKGKWRNKQRVLVLGSRGISHLHRHLMEDLKTLMPHAKADSKMQRKESLFVVNEVAEMKNCNKTVVFEGRRMRDLYMWASNVARGPSVKFLVENIHTMAELKMTGNCLKASRPLLSFDRAFDAEPHLQLIKELLMQIFGVPNHHPKSQPFFDHVYTFSLTDDKIWFRNYQILDKEDGSLAEIGPRFVLQPIKVFDGSFSGQTLWDNPKYVTPTAHRSMIKKIKAGKYQQNVEAKAAYEANRPTEPTYKLDNTDSVFGTIEEDGAGAAEAYVKKDVKKRKRKTTSERRKGKVAKREAKAAKERAMEAIENGGGGGGSDGEN